MSFIWKSRNFRAWGVIRRYVRDRRGNISTLVALLAIPLVGMMGVATETGNWFLIQRSMQNAADSAVIAAATNNNTTGNSYQLEGKSVATKFGYSNIVGTTVTVINTDNSIPATCSNKCYKVTISRDVPVYLTGIVGFTGSGGKQTVAASAVAISADVRTNYCLLSLGPGDGFHVNGGHNVDLHGCNVRSNGDVTCNGANSSGGANSITFYNPGGNKKCAPALQATSKIIDPYLPQAANIPANTCSSYAPTTINTNLNWGASSTPAHYCGDVIINGTVNVNTPSTGSLMVIENGNLIVNGTLRTASGSGLTVVLTGTNTGTHILAGGGTLDIAAPTSGTWSGYAIYQNPAFPPGAAVDMSAAGNSPTWDITGLIYVPNSSLSFSGAVNKSTNGYSCFALVDYAFQSNGTGDILEDQSQCAQAGLNPPHSSVKRTTLVF